MPILLLGLGADPSSAGAVTRWKGSGENTPGVDGSFTLVAESGKLVADVDGQLSARTGTGRKSAVGLSTAEPGGAFATVFESSSMTGTIQGTILNNPPPAGSALVIEIKCNVSYPPLSIKCTIIITLSTE
jgi:hypothetical protein